jgi:hypothetical protein
MVKVLAAELSDQGRLARGKRYWSDDAVVDIVIGHGSVTAEVQGSRPQPYVVTIEAAEGAGIPTKRELWLRCTCPDDTGTGLDACKHAVAAMFALSDELAIEPELVDRWRAGRRAPRPARDVTPISIADESHDPDDRAGSAPDSPGDREGGAERLAEVVPLRGARELDGLALLLRAPEGAVGFELPDPTSIEHRGVRPALLADVLDDALDHLAIRWE